MSYKIASFNIKDFGRTAVFSVDGKDSKKDLEYIAEIIRENRFDIIAIQEISHKLALKELLEKISRQYAEEDRLKYGSKEYNGLSFGERVNESFGYRTKHWEGRWAAPKSSFGRGSAEGYAFIWNRDRIELSKNRKGKTLEPKIDETCGKSTFVRPPFVGKFISKSSKIEFRLINTHIVYGKPSQMKDEESELYQEDATDLQLRKEELSHLIQEVYVKLNSEKTNSQGVEHSSKSSYFYTFLLGDYNLNLKNSETAAYKIPQELQEYSVGNMRIVTVNEELTTLKSKPTDPDKEKELRNDPEPSHHLANNYDHFTYDNNKFADIAQPKIEVIQAFDNYQDTEEESKYDIYRRRVSDHLPISLEFSIRKNRNI